MRQVVLDTETTGLNPKEGHRIIEIGCVELVNRRLTEQRFHIYLNPGRIIDQDAIKVHGITNDFLADKPHFEDIVNDFINFLNGAELIIHNAPFDVGFINHELALLKPKQKTLEDYCCILDTLSYARKKHPGQRNSLDALCKRYAINNSHRELHGALLDAEILADVYLMMVGGQLSLFDDEHDNFSNNETQVIERLSANRPRLNVIRCSGQELKDHQEKLAAIDKTSGGRCVWQN